MIGATLAKIKRMLSGPTPAQMGITEKDAQVPLHIDPPIPYNSGSETPLWEADDA